MRNLAAVKRNRLQARGRIRNRHTARICTYVLDRPTLLPINNRATVQNDDVTA